MRLKQQIYRHRHIYGKRVNYQLPNYSIFKTQTKKNIGKVTDT